MKKTIGVIAIASVLAFMGGCTKIETGNVGIVKHWSGSIDPTPVEGFNWTIFSSITEVDTTQTRVTVNGLTPKDSKGVPLNDVDVTIIFVPNKDNVAKFYSTTHELDTYKDESGREYTVVGLGIIQSLTPHVMQQITSQDQIQNIAKDLTKYEDQASAEFKKEVDAQYPGAYQSVIVRVNKFQMPDSIQKQVDQIASNDAERQRNQSELALVDQRTQLAEKNASIDALALRSAADAAHLTPEQVIAWKQAQAALVQAQNVSGATKVVDVGHK